MEKHCRNAQKLAEFLHGKIRLLKGILSGASGFSGHETAAAKAMKGFGGMISIEPNADKERTGMYKRVKACCHSGMGLGDVKHWLKYPTCEYEPNALF